MSDLGPEAHYEPIGPPRYIPEEYPLRQLAQNALHAASLAADGNQDAAHALTVTSVALHEHSIEADELRRQRLEAEEAADMYRTMYEHVADRLGDVRYDLLIPGLVTREGLFDFLRHDPNAQRSIREGKVGVIVMDGRGLNVVNTIAGHDVGDEYVAEGGGNVVRNVQELVLPRIRSGLERRQQQPGVGPAGQERRRSQERRAALAERLDMPGDTTVRYGTGDEFAILLYDIDPNGLQQAIGRLQQPFTVQHALAEYGRGKIPFIASVGAAHIGEVWDEVKAGVRLGGYYTAFTALATAAGAKEKNVKNSQYAEMRALVTAHCEAQDDAVPNMEGERDVIEAFLSTLCPDFYTNPAAFIES